MSQSDQPKPDKPQPKAADKPAEAAAPKPARPAQVARPIPAEALAVLPLRDIVVFPHMIVPLFVGREKSVRALEAVMKEDKQILLVAQKNAAQDDPSVDDIYRVGTVSTILQLLKLPDGTVKVLVEGGQRARILAFKETESYFEAYVEQHAAISVPTPRSWRRWAVPSCRQFEQYIKLNKKIAPEVLVSLNQIEEPSKLADTVASHLNLKIAEKQELLEIARVNERLEKVFGHMESEIGVLQVEKRIRNRVKRQMEKTQREYYLNEQLKAIQKELGEGEDGKDETAELESRIKKTKLSKEAREKALTELKKLQDHEPDERRGDGGAQLPRLDAVDPLEEAQQGAQRRGGGRERCWTPTTTAWTRSRSASSNIWRCRRAARSCAGRSCASSGRPASARPRSASRSPRQRVATSFACRWAACATKRRSAATGGPISARCPARSSRA